MRSRLLRHLQAGGPYELKQDYINLSAGTQIYEIPAGREINEIMWYSRAELNESFIDPFLGAFGGMGGGMGMGGAGKFVAREVRTQQQTQSKAENAQAKENVAVVTHGAYLNEFMNVRYNRDCLLSIKINN